jgi:NAD/NADP transhydrogenase alpha subunit
MISGMKSGSVILDMAASKGGGNVDGSVVDRVIVTHNMVRYV